MSRLGMVLIFLMFTTMASGEDGAEFARDRLGAALANAEAWRQYDCLMKISSFTDGKKDALDSPAESTTWVRLAIDWDKQEVFSFCQRESYSKGKDSSDQDVLSSKILTTQHLLVRSGELTRNVQYPAPDVKVKFRNDSLARYFDLSVTPIMDVRCAGFLNAPGYLRSEMYGYEGMKRFVESMPRGPIASDSGSDYKVLLSRSAGNIILTSREEHGPITDVIDAKSLLRKRFYQRSLETGFKFAEESIAWHEVDGIFVPTEILYERNYSSPSVSVLTSVDIYWRSLNKSLDRTLFDSRFLDDRSSVLKSIDLEGYKLSGILNPE